VYSLFTIGVIAPRYQSMLLSISIWNEIQLVAVLQSIDSTVSERSKRTVSWQRQLARLDWYIVDDW